MRSIDYKFGTVHSDHKNQNIIQTFGQKRLLCVSLHTHLYLKISYNFLQFLIFIQKKNLVKKFNFIEKKSCLFLSIIIIILFFFHKDNNNNRKSAID